MFKVIRYYSNIVNHKFISDQKTHKFDTMQLCEFGLKTVTTLSAKMSQLLFRNKIQKSGKRNCAVYRVFVCIIGLMCRNVMVHSV